jgi:hypothetical protein
MERAFHGRQQDAQVAALYGNRPPRAKRHNKSVQPAMTKRTLKVGTDGQVYLESAYLCEAQKEPCDRLVKDFESLNDQIRNNAQQRVSGARK